MLEGKSVFSGIFVAQQNNASGGKKDNRKNGFIVGLRKSLNKTKSLLEM
jgi:hypothetical protein